MVGMDVSTILFYLVVGTIVGLLGKFFAPGNRDNIPLWLTVLCGIGGMFLGSFLYFAIFGVSNNVAGNPDYDWLDTGRGVDWWRHFWQIGVAAVLVVIGGAATGRGKRPPGVH